MTAGVDIHIENCGHLPNEKVGDVQRLRENFNRIPNAIKELPQVIYWIG